MTYTLNKEKMYADITDGIAIIINSETGIYYGMNAFTTQIYENLAEGVSAEEIAAAGAQLDFPATFAAELERLIGEMLAKEILVRAEVPAREPQLDKSIAEADGYALELQEFSDAQELLLADPIHNVKEEEGWSPELSSLNEDAEDVARREAKMGS